MADDFRRALSVLLAEFQARLLAEYEDVLASLEAKISGLSAENANLRRSPALSNSDVSSQAGPQNDDAVANDDYLSQDSDMYSPVENTPQAPNGEPPCLLENFFVERAEPSCSKPSTASTPKCSRNSIESNLPQNSLTASTLSSNRKSFGGKNPQGCFEQRGSLSSVAFTAPRQQLDSCGSINGSNHQRGSSSGITNSGQQHGSASSISGPSAFKKDGSMFGSKKSSIVIPVTHPHADDASFNKKLSGSSGASGFMFAVARVWSTAKRGSSGKKRQRQSSDLLRTWGFGSEGLRTSRVSGCSLSSKNSKRVSIQLALVQHKVEHASVPTWKRVMGPLMIDPLSIRRLAWDSVSFLLVVYDLFCIPFEVFDPPETAITRVVMWLIRTWFVLDIALHFFTGYINSEGVAVLDPARVAKHYATRQLHLDLIVVISDWLEVVGGTRAAGMLKGWRVFRIVRILRFKKARDTCELILSYVGSERVPVIARITRMLALLTVITHLVACAWYGIGKLSQEHELGNWQADANIVEDTAIAEKYAVSFHFATAIFLGEHIMLPASHVERLFLTCILCFAFTVQIWFVSSVTTAMTHLEIISTQRSTQFEVLRRFLSDSCVSIELTLKIKTNVKQRLLEMERNTSEDGVEMLKLISDPLMMELHFEIYAPVLCLHPFFRHYETANPVSVARVCHTATSTVSLQSDDWVFQDLEQTGSPRMLFVLQGSLVYRKEGAEPQLVTNKCWITEAVLWTPDWVHCGSLRAKSDCRLLALAADKFQTLVSLDQTAIGPTSQYAHAFVRLLNHQDASSHSDIGTSSMEFDSMVYTSLPQEWQRDNGPNRFSMSYAARTSLGRESSIRRSTGVSTAEGDKPRQSDDLS